MCWHCCKIKAVLRCLQQTWEAHNDKLLLRIIAIILQIRKQRHKEVKQLALYHTTNQWQKWDSRPKGRMLKSGHLFPEFLTSHLVLRCDLFHIGFFSVDILGLFPPQAVWHTYFHSTKNCVLDQIGTQHIYSDWSNDKSQNIEHYNDMILRKKFELIERLLVACHEHNNNTWNAKHGGRCL